MRFGLTGFPLGKLYSQIEDAPPGRVVTEIARAAEELGFAFACGQDHIVTPRDWAEQGAGTTWFDPFVTLSWAAAATTSLRLLTDVLVLPYRSPFQVAKAGATLDAMSQGRLILGVASGYLEEEFRVLQTEYERRGAWTDEGIEVIKAAWENEWFDHEGEFFNARDMAVSPRPVQRPRPPIWVGGNSVRALRRALAHADGWTPFAGDPERLTETMATATGGSGLPEGFDVCAPLRRLVAADGSFDPDEAAARTEGLARAGVTHVKVGFRGPSLAGYIQQMRRFSETVIARF